MHIDKVFKERNLAMDCIAAYCVFVLYTNPLSRAICIVFANNETL